MLFFLGCGGGGGFRVGVGFDYWASRVGGETKTYNTTGRRSSRSVGHSARCLISAFLRISARQWGKKPMGRAERGSGAMRHAYNS